MSARRTVSTIWRRSTAVIVPMVAAFTLSSCGEVARTGQAPAFIIVESMQAASGVPSGEYSAFLLSDVQTIVKRQVNGTEVQVPTTFNDPGRAAFKLALKNPGSVASPLAPTVLNEITLTRYRVTFRRADGRNTQGVDVPYSFDGAMTATVPASGSSVTAGFNLVRHQSKLEPPLSNLVGGGAANMISTVADITFYGRDQAGNEVSVSASFSVNFGDFGDPT